MASVRCSATSLASFLKVDCFGESRKIRYAGDTVDQDIVSRPAFFKSLYVGVRGGKLPIRKGIQDVYHDIEYETWIKDIKDELGSIVVFIEGYAGCGKSVFVQKVLTNVFPDMDYDRNYYNYDIGYMFEQNKQDRIKDAILECFIDQYVYFIESGKNEIVEQMECLLEQEAISCLDNARNIFYEFTNTQAYSDAKRKLIEENDKTTFRRMIHNQLKILQSEQVIYIDCILRLAKYIKCHEEPETQIICYDNLDAIENNVELSKFDDILLTVKENMDVYLSTSKENYRGTQGTPHFVFLATFRKITAVRVGLYSGSEQFGDNRRRFENVYFIDASHLYEYKQMVEKRYNYLSKYLDTHHLDDPKLIKIINQMKEVVQLFSTNIVNTRFAGLWNNNYRTCSDIMECIINSYEDEVLTCIALTALKYDSYNDRMNVAGGASAIFMSIICKVQRDCDYWGELHLSLNELRGRIPTCKEIEQSQCLVKNLTTLSRLILTYINNAKYIEQRNVSIKDLYEVFLDVYTVNDIAGTLANMLTHDRRGIWRRPIVYTKNVIPDGQNIKDKLIEQGEVYRQGLDQSGGEFTEITTCECGESFVKQVSCDFEYYAVRLKHFKSLYLVNDFGEIVNCIIDVYQAVENCCKKMIVFGEYYCKKKREKRAKYINMLFHPRTYKNSIQLHTERVVFNHIDYLDSFRYYIAHFSEEFEPVYKEIIREFILDIINLYLSLYSDYIKKIDHRRDGVANTLHKKWKIVYDNPSDNTTRIRVN